MRSWQMRWALNLLIVANVGAVLGFGLAGQPGRVAETLFFLFLILFAVALVLGIARGRMPPAS